MNDTTTPTTEAAPAEWQRGGYDGLMSIAGIVDLLDSRPGAHVFLVSPRTEVARRMFLELADSPQVRTAEAERDARVERTRGFEVIVWPNGARVRHSSAFRGAFGFDPVHVAIVSQGTDAAWHAHSRDALWNELERTQGEVYEFDHSVPAAPKPTRRTKRMYAHELYPHAEEFETRPLATDVPYLYARAIGLELDGTGWMVGDGPHSQHRTVQMLNARHLALVADALANDLVGDEAWRWVSERMGDYEGSIIYTRAKHYGVDPDRIKPYPCGPVPSEHEHLVPVEGRTYQQVVYVPGLEEECEACTEPIPEATYPTAAEASAIQHFGFDRPETTTEHEENDHA